MLATLQQRLPDELGGLAAEFSAQGVTVSSLAQSGFPADLIVDTADERQADLIVMATHGYSGIKRWALGSVADKVLHATKTPLVLVRARNNA